jgi:hypothetical protein
MVGDTIAQQQRPLCGVVDGATAVEVDPIG